MGYRKRNDHEESDVLRRMLEQVPPVGSHKAGVPPETPTDIEPPAPVDTPEPPTGTRSVPEESAEMSPVIYRPSGPDPERDPDRAPRDDRFYDDFDDDLDDEPDLPLRSDVPVAAQYTEDASVATSHPLRGETSRQVDPIAFDEGLDDDPEIAEDELVDEAEDALLDDLEESPTDDEHDVERIPEARHEPEPEQPSTGLDDVTTPVPPPVPQRRKRRIFGHHDDLDEGVEPPEEPPAVEPDLEPEPAVDTEPHQPVRRRRIRNLHVPATPTDSEIPDPELPDSEVPDPDVDEPGLGEEEIPSPDLDQPVADEPPADEPAEPALRGHVASTRGRGLSGMTVTVLDTTGEPVATTVTGRRGRYAIPRLDAGTYWVVASDTVDGDFNDGTHADHAAIEVQDDRPLDGIDVQQIGRVAIAAAIDASPEGSTAVITVLDRSTGMPAKGSITVTTDHFGTDLALNRGRARISVPGEDLGGRLRIEYSGSRHNAAAKRTVRVR